MNLNLYEGRPVHITTHWGDEFEGIADVYSREYCWHEYGVDEDAIKFQFYILFERDIQKIEDLPTERLCGFSGSEHAPEAVRELYRDLKHVWCAETCAPRMRAEWTPENPTRGQCSITAFLVQELFGGVVRGIPFRDGTVHCYNVLDMDNAEDPACEEIIDLTSEQFDDDEIDYEQNTEMFPDTNPIQSRKEHFANREKYGRYLLLKERLAAYRAEKT